MRVAITGAKSYSGRYLAQFLLDTNEVVSVLNLSSRKNEIANHNLNKSHYTRIEQLPLSFENPLQLTKALEGIDTLYSTYWIRFSRHGDTHAKAAERVKIMFECAAEAGVSKVVMASHTQTSLDSPYDYIRGKAQAEQYLREVSEQRGINYAIVRPCGIFGDTAHESILMNNFEGCLYFSLLATDYIDFNPYMYVIWLS
jgi:nucleoside-diphosphate-sugar epimerase